MKKCFVIIILPLFIILSLFLSGCSGINGLEYNVKYYVEKTSKEQIKNNEARYIVFKNNKSGIMRNYILISTYTNTYTYTYTKSYYDVEFTYTQVDDTTIMTTYREQDRVFDDESYENNDTSIVNCLFVVSKNVVGISYTSSIEYYFNENYLNNNGYFNQV